MKELVLRVVIAWSLIATCLLFIQRGMIESRKDLIVIYKADNRGAEIKGRVVHKEKIGDMYTITIQNYGIFVVSQDNYEFLKIGDEVRL